MMTDQERAELKALADSVADFYAEEWTVGVKPVILAKGCKSLLADLEEAERKIALCIKSREDEIAEREAELAAARQQLAEARADLAGVLLPLQEACDLLGMRRHDSAKEQARAMVSRLLNDRTVIASLEPRLKDAVAPYKRDAERYLALRNGSAICAPAVKPIGRIAVGIPHQPTTENERKALDESVDAALSAKEKSNG